MIILTQGGDVRVGIGMGWACAVHKQSPGFLLCFYSLLNTIFCFLRVA